jgi:mannosyltransferase
LSPAVDGGHQQPGSRAEGLGSAIARFGRRPIVLPVALGLVASLISAFGTAVPGPWRDEEATLVAATRTWGELYELVRFEIDAVHAAYYAVMHLWLSVVPDDIFWMRLPSSIAVGAAVAGVVVLGRVVGSPRAGVIAGIVLLTLPRVLWSATEMRSSAIQIALGVWLTVVFVLAVKGGGWRRWAVWGALSALCGLVFLLLILLPASQVLAATVSRSGRHHLRPAAIAFGASLVALAPLIWLAYRQRGQVSWIAAYDSDVLRVATTTQWFGGGPLYGPMAFLLLGAGAFAIGISSRERFAIPRSILGPLLALSITFPTLALLLTELTDSPLYVDRYTVGSLGLAALVIGIALARLRTLAAAAALVALALFAVPDYLSQRAPEAKSDWAVVADEVASLSRPGDAVYFVPQSRGDRLRGMKPFYPDVFGTLDDIALARTGAQNGSLFDVVDPLESVLGRVDDGQRLVVIAPKTPEASEYVQAILEDSGYREVDSETTSRSTVTVWVR